ncbi:hypothetical protein [Rhizobium leguminosarum]|uniref:hypothetical protein n=1 Tax=Rhizobium leguminosarum TaxID=384 RepID=UPI0004ACA765|nr:hypothetical protein [Rhizobium leguminosarum]
MEVKELLIGDLAPELRLGTVLKGQGIEGFDAGTVYVIECWATWWALLRGSPGD